MANCVLFFFKHCQHDSYDAPNMRNSLFSESFSSRRNKPPAPYHEAVTTKVVNSYSYHIQQQSTTQPSHGGHNLITNGEF